MRDQKSDFSKGHNISSKASSSILIEWLSMAGKSWQAEQKRSVYNSRDVDCQSQKVVGLNPNLGRILLTVEFPLTMISGRGLYDLAILQFDDTLKSF